MDPVRDMIDSIPGVGRKLDQTTFSAKHVIMCISRVAESQDQGHND